MGHQKENLLWTLDGTLKTLLTTINGTLKGKLFRTLDGTLSKDLTTGQLSIKEARWDPKKESIKYA